MFLSTPDLSLNSIVIKLNIESLSHPSILIVSRQMADIQQQERRE